MTAGSRVHELRPLFYIEGLIPSHIIDTTQNKVLVFTTPVPAPPRPFIKIKDKLSNDFMAMVNNCQPMPPAYSGAFVTYGNIRLGGVTVGYTLGCTSR